MTFEHSSFLAHLKQLFDEQGYSYQPFKFEDGSELLTFKITNDEDREIELIARATPDDVWLYFFGRVGNLEDINSKVELVHSLLQLNMVLLGAKTALNDANDILLMSATNNTNLTYEELEEILDNINFASVEVSSLL
jgi:hypothetical protein